MKLKLLSIAHHRNGVGGMPFYVLLVKEGKERFVIIRPTDIDKLTGLINCFVLDVDKLVAGNIQFGYNSWRGDHYASWADEQIEKYTMELENDIVSEPSF